MQMIHVFRSIHNLGHQRSLAQCTDDFVVIAVSDEDERIAFAGKLDRFDVNFRDQRTGRVDDAATRAACSPGEPQARPRERCR